MTELAGQITAKITIEEMQKSIFHRRNEPREMVDATTITVSTVSEVSQKE